MHGRNLRYPWTICRARSVAGTTSIDSGAYRLQELLSVTARPRLKQLETRHCFHCGFFSQAVLKKDEGCRVCRQGTFWCRQGTFWQMVREVVTRIERSPTRTWQEAITPEPGTPDQGNREHLPRARITLRLCASPSRFQFARRSVPEQVNDTRVKRSTASRQERWLAGLRYRPTARTLWMQQSSHRKSRCNSLCECLRDASGTSFRRENTVTCHCQILYSIEPCSNTSLRFHTNFSNGGSKQHCVCAHKHDLWQ